MAEALARTDRGHPGIRLVLSATCVVALAIACLLVPMDRWMAEHADRLTGMNATAAVLILGIVMVLATLAMAPGSPVGIAAGYVLGPVLGVLVMSISSTLGAAAAFLLGRTLFRQNVERLVRGSKTFPALQRGVRQRGFVLVLLLRLSPVLPYNVLNYVLGLTDVKLRDYALASFLGMLPGTMMYVAIGAALEGLSTADRAVDGVTVPPSFLVAGAVATVLVTVLLARISGSALKEVRPEAELGNER